MATKETFGWGNDDFYSYITYELLDVSVDMLEMKVKYKVSNREAGPQGGFYFDPIVGVYRDGKEIAVDSFSLGQGDSVTRELSISLKEGGTFTPSIDIIGMGDYRFTEVPSDFDSVQDYWGDSPEAVGKLTWPSKVTAQEPPDISTLEITDFGAVSENNNTVTISYRLENKIKSGNGEVIEESMPITVEGDEIHSLEVKLEPDKSDSGSIKVTNIMPGEKTVCLG